MKDLSDRAGCGAADAVNKRSVVYLFQVFRARFRVLEMSLLFLKCLKCLK